MKVNSQANIGSGMQFLCSKCQSLESLASKPLETTQFPENATAVVVSYVA